MVELLDFADSLRVPGKLLADPTDLSIAFPHGATELGEVARIEFLKNQQSQVATGEEFGGSAIEVAIVGQSPILVCILRGLNNEMVDKVFPETALGGSTSARGISYTTAGTGNKARGYFGSSRAFKLLFRPRDATRHPALILYRAVPMIEDTAVMSFGIDEDLGMPVVFRGLPDGTGRTYQIQKLADMDL